MWSIKVDLTLLEANVVFVLVAPFSLCFYSSCCLAQKPTFRVWSILDILYIVVVVVFCVFFKCIAVLAWVSVRGGHIIKLFSWEHDGPVAAHTS